jgi:hypothetical protein
VKGGAVSAAGLAGLPVDTDLRAVKAFLSEHRAVFGHGPEALDAAGKTRDYVDPHNGMRTVVWQQTVDGIPVFEGILKAHVTKRGELVNIGSGWVRDANAAAAAGTPGRAALIKAPKISAAESVATASGTLGGTLRAEHVSALKAPEGSVQRQALTAPTLADITAEYTWLPVDANTLRLCWKTVFTVQLRGEMFLALVDAATGEVLLRRGLTEYISDATYQVFTSDSPSPFSPGHATPSTVQPPVVSRTAVTTPALNTTASPNGWIDDGVNETRGNNVDAHADVNADNAPDLPRPQGSPTRVFAPALDLTQAPSVYRDAAIVNLFYWCNRIHDRYYELGFTEAAGNFQNTNFGRGGAGNDAVQADAQDGSGTDNANFSTPSDGSPGRMQMYIFTGPTPDRDGDFDAEIVTHEYTHGLSNRLVGGGIGMSALVSRGMGEGWSDFYALSLLSEAGDNPRGNYAKGGYATYQLSGMTQNYYYGIRRYPYSTDLTKNPLTFKDINPAQANPHTGIPRSTIIGSTADEVHNMGEVWCVTLWEARANLVEKLGFPAGNDLMLQLVTDGMKLAPANPNFLQARDAILQAELVLTGGANRGELWTGFSKRGMGANATAPISSTTTGLVENFDIPDALGISPTAITSISGSVGGPFTPASATFTLVNSTTTPLNWTASDNANWLSLSTASGTLAGSAITTLTANILPAANSLAAGDYTATLTFTNTSSGLVQTRTVSLHIEPITIPLVAETWESGTAGPAWSITGTSAHRTQVTTANVPHGGNYHLTMDSSVDGSLSRNEATWTVNLAGRTGVQLRFWVKMFSDEPNGPPASPFTTGADFDGVAISANGTTWYEVQPLRTLVSTWTRYVVDLDAAIAARGLSYNSAFKIRFNHYDDFGIPTDGFAFDDIDLVQVVTNRLTIALPATTPESGGPISGTVSVIPTPASDLTVTLTSSDTSEATVPPTITIPAGQNSVSFAVNVLDDSELDGTQQVTINASASTYVTGSSDLAVTDDETATLTLTLPASGTEGGAPVTGIISASAAVAADVKVTLQSSDLLNVQVPTTVMITAGQTMASFPVTIVDDSRIDGPQSVTITASVANWTGSSASITAIDNETASLTVTLPSGLREGGTAQNGTVRIAGTLPTSLVVALASSDVSEATVPTTITIVAGQTSATFPVIPIDDVEADGTQTVTITATAAGFVDGNATATVADNDAHHFSISSIVGPILRGSPVALSVSAKDINDVTITSYNQTVGFGAADGATTNIPVTPSSSTGFVNGVLSANLAFGAYGSGVVLAVADTGGHRGTSNPFDVVYGPVSRFQWSAIPVQQYVDAPFPVTIRAVDTAGNSVPTYTGSPALGVALNANAQILSWITYADTTATGEYVQTKQAISTFFTQFTETTTTATDAATLASQLAGKNVFSFPNRKTAFRPRSRHWEQPGPRS